MSNPLPMWRKASRSGQGNNCVEAALNLPGLALVRDSKLGAASPVLATSPDVFASFLAAIKTGRYNR